MNKRTYTLFYLIITLLCAAVVFLSYVNQVNALPYVIACALPTILVAILTKTSYAARINLFLGELKNKKGKFNEENISRYCTDKFKQSENYKKLSDYNQTTIARQKVEKKEKTLVETVITTKDYNTYNVTIVKERGTWKVDDFSLKGKPVQRQAFEGLKKK